MDEIYYKGPRSPRADTRSTADERRASRRSCEFMTAAYVIAEQPPRAVSCLVRDMSSTGARLELERGMRTSSKQPADLPSIVVLYLGPSKTEARCRIAWREGRHFGVKFLTPLLPSRRAFR
jgi:hypothetical protein